jgi:hypothetical protein
MQVHEVTSECNALHGELVACQTKCLGLEQDVVTQQHELQEAKNERLNSMEDIEHYHQTLIGMKE